jgi:hypothetical protein
VTGCFWGALALQLPHRMGESGMIFSGSTTLAVHRSVPAGVESQPSRPSGLPQPLSVNKEACYEA